MSSVKRSLSERMAYTFIQSDLGFYILGRSRYIGATSIWVWPGINPFYHGSCPISASKAALACVFDGAWKNIEQNLLDYIPGEDMPKDVIECNEWYERVRVLHWKTEPTLILLTES